MGIVVLIVLAILWTAFLLPHILRDRSAQRPASSVGDFRRQLRVLGRTTPGGALLPVGGADPVGSSATDCRAVPMRLLAPLAEPSGRPAPRRRAVRRAVKRRRDVVLVLTVAMAGSLLLGALPALRPLWTIHVMVDIAFLAYVGALVRIRSVADERKRKVHYLPTAPPEPALLLRRSAN